MELIGKRFGHTRVTSVIGQGGMGDVYSGYDEKLERKVALKVLNADQRLDAEARERLLREARALSRLDHPNICRIHDYLESGEVDLLVLEYIDGQTLGDAVQDPMTHSERLRIAVAVAGVLVAAHRAGIIHRDLKPDNVMLTRAGEVKVLDFGLARWLHRARTAAQTSERRSATARFRPRNPDTTMTLAPSADSSATAAGIAVGTPLYMSPEQARGEGLTSASDMFSFGLLLQVLFTGEDPHPLGLSSRDVILRVARGETNPVQGVAGDVTALINRLKQFAPADRPTALEAVERLTLSVEKPRRIARRAAVAAAIALLTIGGWRYTVDLQTERAKAVAAQAEAERRRAQAENLIEFMLGDLRKKLEPVGRLDILDEVGQRALEYVGSLNPAAMKVDELARNAKALNQLGDVRLAQGKTPEALRMFRQAEMFTSAAVKREPRNPQALLVHGATEFWLGHALWTQGRNDEALSHMQSYMQTGELLAKIDPANREYLLERAYGHSGVAGMLETKGQYPEALEHYRVSLEVKQELARRDPDDANAQAEVARAYNKVGGVLYSMGDLRAALDHSRREVEIYRQLVRREPKQNQWRQRLASSLGYLGRAMVESGQDHAAVTLWHEELSIERELSSLDRSNVNWQRAVAMTSRRLAVSSAEHGERQLAMALFREARQGIANAIRDAPTRTSFVVDAAHIDTEYARFLASTGSARDAVTLLAEVQTRLEPLLSGDRSARLQSAATSLLQGDLARVAHPETAAAHWARAERELEPLAASSNAPNDLAVWFRILVRRKRLSEARAVLARLQRAGYDTSDLQRLCMEQGC
ncbi:MAG: protein kinase [Acidobacteriota bacterium]